MANRYRNVKFMDLPEQTMKNFNQDFAHLGEKLTGPRFMAIGMVWALVGVLIVNLEVKMLAWISPLGWFFIALGALSMGMAAVALHQQRKRTDVDED